MPRVRTREWNGSESGEPPFTSGITVPVVSMLVEVPQRPDRQHEAVTLVAVRERATAKEVVAEVASHEDGDEAIVAEVVVWVRAVAASRPKVTLLVMLSLPTRSQKPELNLPKTRLRKGQIVMQTCERKRFCLRRLAMESLQLQHTARRLRTQTVGTKHKRRVIRRLGEDCVHLGVGIPRWGTFHEAWSFSTAMYFKFS